MRTQHVPPVAALAFLLASLACAQTGLDGHWEGILKADSREIALSLDLAMNAKSEWIASMGVPAQNVNGLYVKDLVVNGKSVKFLAVELQMSICDLTLGADGKLTGIIAGPRGSTPIEFQRKGEAKVQLPAPSPAVSKQFEGDWEGTLQMPGGGLPVTLHFKNQPDQTVAATIDVPKTGAIGMPLNDVRQSGQKLEFGLKIAHGSFQGAMNQEGTEITGQLSHEAESMALTLRKK